MSWHSIPIFFYWLLTGFYITSGQLPVPTITAFPGRVINRGENVTIRCEAPINKLQFCLYHVTNYLRHLDVEGNTADFPIINANKNDSGEYYCYYIELQNNSTLWSARSDYLQIEVIDLKKPEISWDTDPEDRSKDRFRCFIPQPPEEYQLLRCLLYQNLIPFRNKNIMANSSSCSFSIPVQDISDLRCLYVVQVSDSSKHQIRSPLSDPVRPAEDLKKPEISWGTDPEDRSKARVICSAPNPPDKYELIQCVLYNNMTLFNDTNFNTTSSSCAFSVPVRDLSEIRCSYVVQDFEASKDPIRSPLSDPVKGRDYTNGNIIRLLLSGIILLMLCIIIQNHIKTVTN